MIPSTVNRVPAHTASDANCQIRRQTEDSIARTVAQGRAAINRRLQELDAEWDIERTLEANAATVSLVGLTLGTTVDRRILALPFAVGLFLLQHAVQGWCPPMEWFRRMGIRTQSEIDYERYALKVIRGDFDHLPDQVDGHDRTNVKWVLDAVRR